MSKKKSAFSEVQRKAIQDNLRDPEAAGSIIEWIQHNTPEYVSKILEGNWTEKDLLVAIAHAYAAREAKTMLTEGGRAILWKLFESRDPDDIYPWANASDRTYKKWRNNPDESMHYAEYIAFHGIPHLAEKKYRQYVPSKTNLWWNRYVEYPCWRDPAPDIRCALFVMAGELPENFTEPDFLTWLKEHASLEFIIEGFAVDEAGKKINTTRSERGDGTVWRLTEAGYEAIQKINANSENKGNNIRTWLQRMRLKKAKWEDITITCTEKAILYSHQINEKKQYGICSWEEFEFPRPCRERLLLEWFQKQASICALKSTSTTKAETITTNKDVVSRLRRKLIKISGINQDPLIFSNEQVTRVFKMCNEDLSRRNSATGEFTLSHSTEGLLDQTRPSGRLHDGSDIEQSDIDGHSQFFDDSDGYEIKTRRRD